MKKYFINSFILTALYLSIFSVVYLVHVNFLNTDVIFYSAFGDALLSVFIFAVVFFITKLSKSYSKYEVSQIFIIFILVGYSISISLPTVIDRSLSFYILEKINTYDGSINRSSLRDVFVNDYIDEYKLVEVRITEQVASGTIEVRDGCIYLTNKGKIISGFSSFFRKNLLAKKRLILDKYTDVLTDPFKNSTPNSEYFCQPTSVDR